MDLSAVAFSYKQVLGSDDVESKELAKLTKGYAFAYQLLGYILYRHSLKYVNDLALREYDELLRTRVYSKIWSELSKKEKDILKSMTKENGDSNQGITKNTGLSQNALAVYKKRLMDKGLIFIPERAKISFSLPCFKEFIFYMIDFEII